MNLLIDMGNTRLKWGVGNNLDFVPGLAIDNAKINRDSLFRLWQSLAPPIQLAISCVSANQLLTIVLSVAKELWPTVNVNLAKSTAHAFGVSNAYQEPEKLGVDRWLCLLAGYNTYQKALCIVDCGTAITVDMVDVAGNHLGGLISPGLRLMKESLAKGTEKLGLNESIYPYGLANFTEAAIHNGTLSASCGFIEFALKSQPDDLQLLLTGGDCEAIARHLSRPALIEPDLVLRGLSLTLAKLS